jgi:hypothetical protein
MSTATPFPGAHSPHPLDFEAYSTAAIIDNLREHRGCRTPTFPLMPATICRLTPPRTMRGSSQGKNCGS